MKSRSLLRWLCLAACFAGLLLAPRLAAALEPDEIALIVNKNVPESRKLAEEYARLRHVPDGRIIETASDPVSLGSPAEEISYLDFEPQIAQPVRDFLVKNKLQEKVKCLVTFWGVPLRVGPRTLGPFDVAEMKQLQTEQAKATQSIVQDVEALEAAARQVDPAFLPEKGQEMPQIEQRINAAVNHLVQGLARMPDPQERKLRFNQALGEIEQLVGTPRTRELISTPQIAGLLAQRPDPQKVAEAKAEYARGIKELTESEQHVDTPEGRATMRQTAKKYVGLLGYGYAVGAQLDLFNTDQSEAAVDSELSLIWWKAYPRRRWVDNPLSFHFQAALRQHQRPPLTAALMVSRLDAPSAAIVHNIIEQSVKVEQKGLQGQVALDARGLPPTNDFGRYDQTIRNLAEILKDKTKLKVTFDNTPALLPAHQLNPPIALYCGWYSLRNYSPPGRFAEGAVGFHVASFELISLRLPNEHGWVRGLLSDGVVGTLGPVAEPYLESFPKADEFFPLLLTGKLTLAEVYWRTLPWSSWMQDLIGDPLYVPYKNDPPLKVEDLPPGLAAALQTPVMLPPATQPAAAAAAPGR